MKKLISQTGTTYNVIGTGNERILVQQKGVYFIPIYADLLPDGRYYIYPGIYLTAS